MDSFLIAYITQRMKEMGFCNFHFEPVRIANDTELFIIKAYNEYYYLVGKTVPSTLVIQSDTNIFNEAATYSNLNFYQIQEFTGLIEILYENSPYELEFIRVTPY
jgi:hypothetical protein